MDFDYSILTSRTVSPAWLLGILKLDFLRELNSNPWRTLQLFICFVVPFSLLDKIDIFSTSLVM